MGDKIPESLLKTHPQLRNIYDAIDEFKKSSNLPIKCPKCNSIIIVTEDREKGVLETSCSCGKCRYRMRWSPS